MTPEQIAARLSPAQRKALLSGFASNWPNRNSMIGSGLARSSYDSMGLEITDLGLAVRRIIEQEATDA